MNSKTRLETAWSFTEPDRVPIELKIAPSACEMNEATSMEPEQSAGDSADLKVNIMKR